MASEKVLCWTLIFAGLIVQAATRRLDLMAILIPTAALIAIAVTGMECRKTTDSGHKKGVA